MSVNRNIQVERGAPAGDSEDAGDSCDEIEYERRRMARHFKNAPNPFEVLYAKRRGFGELGNRKKRS